jgi:hypothetical protein
VDSQNAGRLGAFLKDAHKPMGEDYEAGLDD